MEEKKFNLWNRITSLVVFVIASITYLSTIEPTASFWDCGEFIASSYKLEVGHPPGNPVFQLIARFFTMFGNAAHAAVAVNAMSAMCSALTILFLYLTIVFFAKRLVKPSADGTYSVGNAIAIFGSGAIGGLVYTFSDTFWFSAVEGEVYAMSSLFTAMVFWCMTKWYEQADRPHAARWIVLISFLMGLSIGVHLLNLLAIPCIVFMYYYRMKEDGKYTFWQLFKILLVSGVILGLMVFIVIPYLPKMAAYFDLFFVNNLSLPVNSGAAFFVAALLALCFWGVLATYKLGKVFLNTTLLCFTTIIVGFSLFSIVIIRSSVMTPTNENQPDNAFSLVRYLSREQYGSTPLIYGQYYGSPYAEIINPKYWTLIDGKYRHVDGPLDAKYAPEAKMLFPRMWSNMDQRYVDFYETYTKGKGKTVGRSRYKKPTMGANLSFFFDFQLNWMYWRYFMWNFVGRQNDVHSPTPGEIFYGNWESGIRFLDEFRLGDQRDAPAPLKENKGKNHYYFLPLLLGLLGLFFQFDRDKRGCWLTFLLFFMTGIAIVVYLNQPPFQVRERDYAYAGSFYAFSIWVGFAVVALYDWLSGLAKSKNGQGVLAGCVTALCLVVPAIMAAQNWDDHDRSHRRTAVEMARNYLESVGPQGLLVTHGDNDTFPLWYAQEVDGIRTDVRICNTSLLGTDWYIGQMKYAINDSKPLPISIDQSQYLYGTNDYVNVYDTRDQVIPISEVMRIFKHPDAKVTLEDGTRVDYIVSRKISVPVNKENCIKYGIVPESLKDCIQDEIVLQIPKDKNMLSKPELFFLDLLSGYEWDRPINFLSEGGDLNIGLRSYMMFSGYSSQLVPFPNKISSTNLGLCDLDDIYDLAMNRISLDALSRKDYFVDYQNIYTFIGVIPQREIFVKIANALLKNGQKERALDVLDRCMEKFPEENFPLESICLGFYNNDLSVIGMVEAYYKAGNPEKARDLAKRFSDDLFKSTFFFLEYYDYAQSDFEKCANCIYYLTGVLEDNGEKGLASELNEKLEIMLRVASGDFDDYDSEEEPVDSAYSEG